MILVTGGTGQLGTALKAHLDDAVFPTRSELDLAQPDTVAPSIDAHSPTAIINAAAYNEVDRAEEDEATAMAVNAESVGVLAAYASARSIPFVTVSTDYVFDGQSRHPYVESSTTAPINAYGRSKLAGERLALANHPGSLVVRTSWVFSATHDSFVSFVLERARSGVVRATDDQRSVPTSADDLAAGILAALAAEATGVLHLTNSGDATRYELAVEAVRLAGLSTDSIQAATSADFASAAKRPDYSVMQSERLAGLDLVPLRPWKEALAPVLERIVSK